MALQSYITTNKLLILSIVLLAIGFFGLKFLIKPPRLPTILTTQKPGVLTIQIPEKVLVNQPFKLTLEMDTQNQNVNAAGVYLIFEASKLRVLNIDTADSFCQFYPEKRFDNNLGMVSLACGSPHPGFSGKNNLVTLELMPLVLGKTQVSIDPKSQLLLSNGKGTNILTDFPKISLIILNSL
jgi:hypothetical protein